MEGEGEIDKTVLVSITSILHFPQINHSTKSLGHKIRILLDTLCSSWRYNSAHWQLNCQGSSLRLNKVQHYKMFITFRHSDIKTFRARLFPLKCFVLSGQEGEQKTKYSRWPTEIQRGPHESIFKSGLEERWNIWFEQNKFLIIRGEEDLSHIGDWLPTPNSEIWDVNIFSRRDILNIEKL